MLYVHKPITVEAISAEQAIRDSKNGALPEWLKEAFEAGHVLFKTDEVRVYAKYGHQSVGLGDWIVRGRDGRIYPCDGPRFTEMFEAVKISPAGVD